MLDISPTDLKKKRKKAKKDAKSGGKARGRK